MESGMALKDKGVNYDVVVEIQNPGTEETSRKSADFQRNGVSESKEDLPREQKNLVPPPDFSAKPPLGPAIRQRSLSKSAYSKPKSRIVEPPHTSKTKPVEENAQPARPAKSPYILSPKVASPSVKVNPGTPKASAPITPKTPLMAAAGGDDDEDDDDKVYEAETFKNLKAKRGKKVRFLILIEWIAFVSLITVLITSLTVNKLKGLEIWGLKLWRWCVLVSVIFCGRLFTGWFTNTLVFSIEKNFLLKKKVLYFLFALKKSFRVVIWLALILLAWGLLFNRGVKRSHDATKILNHITRGIVSTLVAAVLWMGKTLLVKLVASSFHVRTYFDRIQESIFHQYILEALSRAPTFDSAVSDDNSRLSCQLSFNSAKNGKQEKGEVINVDKLYKIRREKVSAWTMGGLIKVINSSGLTTVSELIDDSLEEEHGEPKEITSEVGARAAAKRIFRNVAKYGHKYIEQDDLLLFMPKEEVDNAFPLFEGAAETGRITKSSFRNWVVKAYNERKCLAVSLKDAKTAIEELNKIASGIILIVIIIVWLLLMEITTNKVLIFISSQMLLVVFMFGNTAKMVFEALIFVFVMHPFDVGDRCVVDGVQMVVDEMNILTTIFLKPDNEKIYYPNSVLATKPISNFNRSPEMGDSVDFAVDFSTSVEKISDMKDKIKAYLESKPQQWHPSFSVQLKEIVDVHKLNMALYVNHTMNFQNSGERGNRKSDLVFELKRIFEELGITYRLLPQGVQVSYA
ncbi:mechanosensitive ion channel protein 10-like [Primulina tabacum]|uniref:mechanosensitive ion channel protein 10-like n=1 Tax=Primulina tabacum TaxID=48773 RepID=UPI003F5A94A8